MPQISIQTATGETAQYHCPAGTNLYDFLAEHHLLDAPCGGAGTCGKCKIRMTASTFIVLPQERAFFTEEELAAGWRLACLHQVQEDAALLLPPPESVSQVSCKGFLR